MAELQRVHPAVPDEEARPTVPLVPSGAPKSESVGGHFPARHYQPPRRKESSCCCRLLCCLLCTIILIIVIIGILAGIFFLVFQPKLPKYSITELSTTRFNVSGTTLDVALVVTIVARNPNKKIGISYEGGSRIDVWYASTEICEGSLPKFYQGHRNTTVLKVALTGTKPDAEELISMLQQVQKDDGRINLRMRARQPVRIKVGRVKLMKVKLKVTCDFSVDRLVVGDTLSYGGSSCKFRFRF